MTKHAAACKIKLPTSQELPPDAGRRCHNGRRLATPPGRGVRPMRITLHIWRFTVTIIVKSRNRHSAK